MKIATYNVNGINGRLDVLLRWLEEAKPDVAYLQELKAPDEKPGFLLEKGSQAGNASAGHDQADSTRSAAK
jgi:exodeoxyribonuclease-3